MESGNETHKDLIKVPENVKHFETKRSLNLFKKTKRYIPTGASSLMRTSSWDDYPIFMKRAKGTRMWDVDGNE